MTTPFLIFFFSQARSFYLSCPKYKGGKRKKEGKWWWYKKRKGIRVGEKEN